MHPASQINSLVLECSNCSLTVSATITGSYIHENSDDWICSTQYSLCRCPECSSPILARQQRDYNGVDAYWEPPVKLYPRSLFHINPIIPEKLKIALVECIQCYKSQSYTATVMMCRRALEGFCQIKGVKEKNLDKSIKKLNELGLINSQLYEWADALRLAGNEAAHNIELELSPVDAKDLLDFTIAILDFTYSFKDKFDKFKARMKNVKEA